MFKKRFKLNTPEFSEVFASGKIERTSLYLLKTKESGLPYARFAVAVSKKISKRAVERNHLKRKFLHALKEVAGQIKPSDYVFILNSEIKDIQYKDLIANLKQIFT